ncbi:MAG: formylglycine-generating enzyme family protein [Leptospiraceae bacterium]|nr:formylglycine-generating enzyme family protein [Leptospiraceae bacterium]MDW7976711.1 SUMF1/EgtB/PvdO family nonheme iron enzyme [Leptospiraceae bacterium]
MFTKPEEPCKKSILNVDYSKMSCVPAGYVVLGSNRPSIDEDTGKVVHDTFPEHQVYLTSYWIDQYEVTYGEYQECVKAGICSFAKPNYQGFSDPMQPMVGVNWYQAHEYCRWKGKRLPTEAEWEKGARGEKGEIFPWGNEPADCQKAVIKENEKTGCGVGTTWKIGSKGAFRYNLYDMAGNAWEWVHDWYAENYEICGMDCLSHQPKGPCQGEMECYSKRKIVKGGSWWWKGEYAQGYNRRAHFPKNQPFHHFGFRCAVDGE